MTMLSRHMNQLQHQPTQPAFKRRTAWKKVVSTFNCCRRCRSKIYGVDEPYEFTPAAAYQTSQQNNGHVTVYQERRSSPLKNKTMQSKSGFKSSKSPSLSTSKGQRKIKKSRKVSFRPKNREIIFIQANDCLVNGVLHQPYKSPEQTKICNFSRGLKNLSTVIKYATSISFSTIQSLSPEGTESLTDAFKRQKYIIKSLVKSPASSVVPHVYDQSTASRICQTKSPMLPGSNNRPCVHSPSFDSHAEASTPYVQHVDGDYKASLTDREVEISFESTVTVRHEPVASHNACDAVTEIQQSIGLGVTSNTQVKGECREIAQRLPVKHPVAMEHYDLSSMCLPKEPKPVKRQEPKPVILKEDGGRMVAGAPDAVDLVSNYKTQTPESHTVRLQLKDVQQRPLLEKAKPEKVKGPEMAGEVQSHPEDLTANMKDAEYLVVRLPRELCCNEAVPNSTSKGSNVLNTTKAKIQSSQIVGSGDKQSSLQNGGCRSGLGDGKKPRIDLTARASDLKKARGTIKGTGSKPKQLSIKKGTTGKPSPTKKCSKLQRLFPECQLFSQGDFRPVYHTIYKNREVNLGKGAYGTVNLIKNKKTGRLCAVKTFHNHIDQTKIFEEAKAEVLMLTKLKGLSCVPELFGIVPAKRNTAVPSIVQEFIGDEKTVRTATLESVLSRDILSSAAIFRIALNVVQALKDIHSKGVLHCDLKVDNILLMPGFQDQRDHRIKIIDFGKAISVNNKPKYEQLTPEKQQQALIRCSHIDPEVVLGKRSYDVHSEIYSLGVLFINMAGYRCKYLKKTGKTCVRKDLLRRPTLDKLEKKLTLHIKKKKY